MIEARNVSFDYIRRDETGNVTAIVSALDDVSFRIKRGEFVAILGANGSGKSTLARHINALLVPEEGSIIVDGIDTTDEERVYDIRRKVGMVFQNPDNQIVAGVVEEDVAFGPENMGIDPDEIRIRVDESLNALGISHVAHLSPNSLSGGQKARVSIAGILAMKPKCIVFDEATAMLDPNGRKDVLSAAISLKNSGVTILWITHHMDEVADADNVLVMDSGRIVMAGKPWEIFEDVDRLHKYRLDVPQLIALAHELKKRGLEISRGVFTPEQLAEEIYHGYTTK